jgi:hypothetical protein
MRTVSQDTKDLINDLAKDAFGKSVLELEAENEMQSTALRESNTALIRAIINFRDKMNLNAEQISNMLDIDLDFVIKVLSKLEE